jgi:hypothetical protein
VSHSSAEEQLIVWSAGTAMRREARRGQAERLAETVDWRRLAELLGNRRLLATLGPIVAGLALAPAGDELAAAVARALESGRRHGAFLQLTGERVRAALVDAGIRCTALKGPGLSEAIYGDLGRRYSSDIDLLVAPEQLDAAVAVVRELGYEPPVDRIDADGLPLLHFALIHERGLLPPIELHWRIHWYERRYARECLLAPAQAPAGWRPAPADELIALLLFYARDGFISLRHAADIAAWWDACGSQLQATAIDERIASYGALEPVLLASAKAAEKTVGLPAARIGGRGRRLGVRGAIAVRLADPHPHSSEVQLYADMGLIDGLLTPSGGLRALLRRQLVAPVDGGPRRAPVKGWRAGSGLAHTLGLLGRYGMALTRLFRGSQFARSG